MSQDTNRPFIIGMAFLLAIPLHSQEVEKVNSSLPNFMALSVDGTILFVQDTNVGLTVVDDAFKARCMQSLAANEHAPKVIPESATPMVFSRWGQFRNLTMAQFRKAAMGVEY